MPVRSSVSLSISVLENESLFVNVDATGFGILDRRLDWQALGVELPEGTDVAFIAGRYLRLSLRHIPDFTNIAINSG
jgi:hypothetical protein